jgi:alpha-glucosidase
VVDVDGRDPERAPIPWQPGPGGGFTSGEPWLPLIAEADELCVARQADDPDSPLWLYRRLAELRAGSEALQSGSQRTLDLAPGLLAWVREAGEERILAIVNFLDAESGPIAAEGSLILSSLPGRDAWPRALDPFEAVLVRLEP